MPITQDRMILLIRAASSCYEAYRDISQRIDDLVQEIYVGRISEADAWRAIVSYKAVVSVPPEAMLALGSERSRFTKSKQHDNCRRAEKMRKMRLQRGTVPRTDFISPQEIEQMRRLVEDDTPARPAARPVPRHRHLNKDLMEEIARETTTHRIGDSEVVIPPATDAISPEDFDPVALEASGGTTAEWPDEPDDDSDDTEMPVDGLNTRDGADT